MYWIAKYLSLKKITDLLKIRYQRFLVMFNSFYIYVPTRWLLDLTETWEWGGDYKSGRKGGTPLKSGGGGGGLLKKGKEKGGVRWWVQKQFHKMSTPTAAIILSYPRHIYASNTGRREEGGEEWGGEKSTGIKEGSK